MLLARVRVVGVVLVEAVLAEVNLHVLGRRELEVLLIDRVGAVVAAHGVEVRLLDRLEHVLHELELLLHVGHVFEGGLRRLEPLEGGARVCVLQPS